MMLSIFSCAYLLSVGFPQRNIHFGLWPIFFFSLFVCIFDTELHELFVCFGDEFLVGLFLCKYFFLF